MRSFGGRGGWWVAAQISLIALILIVPGPRFPPFPAMPGFYPLAGGLLLLSSLLILLSGAKSLSRALTPFPYPLDNATLVREGLYRYVRHPLYLGVILGGLGVALWRMSLVSLGLSLVLALFLNAKASREEIWLLAKYPGYESYRRKTKKLIPFLY